MTLPTLYSRTHTGAIQQWTIEIEDNKYRTHFGQVDGKIQTTEWTICHGKNIGKKNETSPNDQALKEACSLFKKQKESNYWEDINDIDKQSFVEPMLAKNFDDYKDELKFPILCQPKYDGCRCVISKNGMFSRNGKEFVSCPHIQGALQSIFDKYPDVVLDGELYCDKLSNDFNRIISLVKKSKPTEEDLIDSMYTIQYWIYDCILPGEERNQIFSYRKNWIATNLKDIVETDDCIRLVPTHVANSHEELTSYFEKYVEEGYEGQMIRLDMPYENKRSKSLLKRKEFQDAEFNILDIIEGEGQRTGMAGYMMFRTDKNDPFKSNIKGDRVYLRELLVNKEQYIGKSATIKFFNWTPGDHPVPRFPYVININRESYE